VNDRLAHGAELLPALQQDHSKDNTCLVQVRLHCCLAMPGWHLSLRLRKLQHKAQLLLSW
jgi:hypothetical protein